MGSVIAILLAAAGIAGAFFTGVAYGKDIAYDEAIEATSRIYAEVYREEV